MGWLFLVLLSTLTATQAHAWSFDSHPNTILGAVYARSLVLGDNGKPIFVEFDSTGAVVNVIGEAIGPLADGEVMAGDLYRAYAQAFDSYKSAHEKDSARGAYVLSREEYEATTFKTFRDQTVNRPPLRYSATKSVLVRHKQTLATPDTAPILLESPIDLKSLQFLAPNIKSVLLNKAGQVIRQSENDIGYRAAYRAKGPDQPPQCNQSSTYGVGDDTTRQLRWGDDAACGPVAWAELSMWTWYGDVYAWTDERGKYSLQYLTMPCPGFSYDMAYWVTQKVYYSNFHPRSAPRYYYQMKQYYDYCSGEQAYLMASGNLVGLMTFINTEAIAATSAVPLVKLNFPVDVVALTGWGDVSNAAVGGGAVERGATSYTTNLPGFKQEPPQNWDFDSDGQKDAVAEWTDPDNPDVSPKPWGVWLGGRKPGDKDSQGNPIPPDFTIVPHPNADYGNQGLLSSLSEEDFKKTDLYVYRVATGERIAEQKGLADQEADSAQNRLYLRLLLPTGPQTSSESKRRFERPYYSDLTYNLDLIQRDADTLRAGEAVKVIAINRITGYIGTETVTIKPAHAGVIDLPVRNLKLGPPNLKLRAERWYDVESGLTKDEERHYLIGFEGSGLSSDTVVALISEWYDQDGTALPSDLPGYTGRLAKTVGDRSLDNGVAHFEVKPGHHIELLRLSGTDLVNENYYVHINGQSYSQGLPDFGGTGAGDGVLQFRPSHYVPVMVPVYDEEASRQAKNELVYARKDDIDTKNFSVDPVYRWVYRPEMQFSVYGLTVKDLKQGHLDENGNEILTPIDKEKPVISSYEDFVKILYDLAGSSFEKLDPLTGDGHDTLVFAIGEQEVTATLGKDNTVQLDNLEHLSSLHPEDYLTISLYQNGDAGNLLWQFAFEYLAIDTRKDVEEFLGDDGVIRISADDTVLPLKAVLFGYADRAPEKKKPQKLTWIVEGEGSIEPVSQTDSDLGVFDTTLTMPTIAGSHATIKAMLNSGGDASKVTAGEVLVEPGEPRRIEITSYGEVSALGHGSLSIIAMVYDQFGNTVKDGTPVTFSADGMANQEGTSITVGGQATTTITGAEFAQSSNTLTVRAGDATAQHEFEVYPLNVAIADLGPTYTGRIFTANFTVTDHNGAPASGVTVDVSSTYGIVQEAMVVTDGAGHGTVQIMSPPNPGTSKLIVRAGFAGLAEKDYEVTPPFGVAQRMNTRQALVVGDKDAAGQMVHDRYDGVQIAFDYSVATDVMLTGTANESVALTLGDLSDPNLAPLAAYAMTGFETNAAGILTAPDMTGLNPAIAENLTLAADHPLGVGGHSYKFNGDGKISVPNISAIARSTSIGFRVDVKPTATDVASIVDFGSGAYRVTYDSAGRIVYEVQTGDGAFSVVSAPLSVDTWHSIAGRYYNGTLELEVDGALYQAAVTGDIIYNNGTTLNVGEKFAGFMSGLRFYDWNSAHLMAFSSGGNTDSVVLDAGGSGSISVHSLGHMNDQQSGSAISLLRIAIISGDERKYVSVVSSELYGELGSYYIDNLAPDAPPINMAGITRDMRGGTRYAETAIDYFVTPAHAWDFSVSNFSKWVGAAVSWVIPYEDIMMLGEQIYYLATSDSRFDPMQLALSAVSTLTVIPIAKPLKFVIGPLKSMLPFVKLANNKFIKSFASIVGGAVKRAWDSKSFQRIVDLLPMLIIAGEMMADPEARDGLLLIVKTVQSDDDLWAWFEYLRLPTDGWSGSEADMPELNLYASADTNVFSPATMLAGVRPLDWLVSPAHASGMKGKRVGVVAIKELTHALGKLRSSFTSRDMSEIIDGVKGVTEALKKTDWSGLRRLAHKPQTLIFAKSVGKQAIVKLYKRSKNIRMSPLTITAVIAYLETRKECGVDDGVCQKLNGAVADKLVDLYKAGFTAALLSDVNAYGPRESAGFFHLAMVALKHLEFEAQKSMEEYVDGSQLDVVDVEKDVEVNLYKRTNGEYRVYGKSYGRKIDIVLGENAPNPNSVWMEVKSYKRPALKIRFTPWSLSTNAGSWTHRQFFLDRVALVSRPGYPALAGKVLWRFQRFKRITSSGGQGIESYTDDEMKSIRNWLRKFPKERNLSLWSLGFRRSTENDSILEVDAVNKRVQLQSIKTWVLGLAKDYLLAGIDQKTINELIVTEIYE